jgi:hypothetical protein
VLGLIAGLTVPSIVVSVDRGNNKAKIKEAFQTLTAITQEGVLNGDFANITNWDIVNSTDPKGIVGYITSKINYSKQCLTTDITSEGCKRGWGAQPPSSSYNQHNARWILPNGVKLQAFRPGYFNATYMLWTVTTKAYAADMQFDTNNPDSTVVVCNVGEQPYDSYGVIIKSGMCDGFESTYWKPQLDNAMGNT